MSQAERVGLTGIAPLEAEMRDRLRGKDLAIAQLRLDIIEAYAEGWNNGATRGCYERTHTLETDWQCSETKERLTMMG